MKRTRRGGMPRHVGLQRPKKDVISDSDSDTATMQSCRASAAACITQTPRRRRAKYAHTPIVRIVQARLLCSKLSTDTPARTGPHTHTCHTGLDQHGMSHSHIFFTRRYVARPIRYVRCLPSLEPSCHVRRFIYFNCIEMSKRCHLLLDCLI